jgi:hypothetical protein
MSYNSYDYHRNVKRQSFLKSIGDWIGIAGMFGVIVVWILSIVASLAVPIVIVLVAIHFIAKYW